MKLTSNLLLASTFFLTFFIAAFPMPKETLGFLSPLVILLFSIIIISLLLLNKSHLSLKKMRLFPIYFYALLSILIFESLALLDSDISSSVQGKYLIARAILFLFFISLVILLSSYGEKAKTSILKALLWSSFIISILIILEGFSIISVGNETIQGRVLFNITLPFRKATGLPMSDGKLGTLLAPAFLIVISSYISTSLLKLGRIKHLLLFTIALGILISQSRSTWLGLFLSIPFLLFLGSKKELSYLKSIFYSFFITSIVIIFIFNIPQKILTGLVSNGIYASNVSNRLNGPLEALQSIKGNIILGAGKNVVKYEHENGEEVVIHNMFVDQLISSGILGFLPLFFIYFFPLTYIFNIRNSNRRHEKIWVLATIIHLVTELTLYRGFYNEYAIIYLSLFIYLFKPSRLNHEQKRGYQIKSLNSIL